jgi:hypothetical protein
MCGFCSDHSAGIGGMEFISLHCNAPALSGGPVRFFAEVLYFVYPFFSPVTSVVIAARGDGPGFLH